VELLAGIATSSLAPQPLRISGIRSPAATATIQASRREHGKSLEVGAVSELQGIARFKFHEGKLEEFTRLAAQCTEIVRTMDTGTL